MHVSSEISFVRSLDSHFFADRFLHCLPPLDPSSPCEDFPIRLTLLSNSIYVLIVLWHIPESLRFDERIAQADQAKCFLRKHMQPSIYNFENSLWCVHTCLQSVLGASRLGMSSCVKPATLIALYWCHPDKNSQTACSFWIAPRGRPHLLTTVDAIADSSFLHLCKSHFHGDLSRLVWHC